MKHYFNPMHIAKLSGKMYPIIVACLLGFLFAVATLLNG